MIGIYKITNLKTNQSYIGQSLDIDALINLYKVYYGVDIILIYLFMIRREKFGLIKEACIDYPREEEYGYYWYVIGKSILDIISSKI